ncbi:hypothetical protein [Streptomyces sp. Qhu_M48]|uniref:hypothetical protein n=1 Tax=Streptomyces sp. Qhu_M48 TaxID=3435889 RepID=UPI003F4F60D3
MKTALLKRTWVDWGVCLSTAVIAVRCQSPFLVVFLAVVALVAAGVGARKTWQMTRPQNQNLGSRVARLAQDAHGRASLCASQRQMSPVVRHDVVLCGGSQRWLSPDTRGNCHS